MADLGKALKIKTGVVSRTAKELQSYTKEERVQTKHIEALTTSGADEHDVRQQERVLQETLQMLPDVKRRLQAAVDDLQAHLTSHADQLQDKAVEVADARSAIQTALSLNA